MPERTQQASKATMGNTNTANIATGKYITKSTKRPIFILNPPEV